MEEENKEEKPEEEIDIAGETKPEEAGNQTKSDSSQEEPKPKTEHEIKLEMIKKLLDDEKKGDAVEVVEGESPEEKKEEASAEGDEKFFKKHKNAFIFTGIAVAVIVIIIIAVRLSSPTGNAVEEFDLEKEIENLDIEEEQEESETPKKTVKKTEEESLGIKEKIKEKFQALFATEEEDDFEEIDEILYEDENNTTKELASIKDRILEGISGFVE